MSEKEEVSAAQSRHQKTSSHPKPNYHPTNSLSILTMHPPTFRVAPLIPSHRISSPDMHPRPHQPATAKFIIITRANYPTHPLSLLLLLLMQLPSSIYVCMCKYYYWHVLHLYCTRCCRHSYRTWALPAPGSVLGVCFVSTQTHSFKQKIKSIRMLQAAAV